MHFRSRTIPGAVVLAMAGTMFLQAPSYAAKSRISASTTKPIVNESFAISGKLSKSGKRAVTVQYLLGSTWTKLATTKSSKSGAFKLTTRIPKDVNRKYRAVSSVGTTPMKWIYPQAQSMRVSFAKAPIGQSRSTKTQNLTSGTAAFTPARNGRGVSVERKLSSGKWTKVATGRQDKTGRFTFWGYVPSGATYRATAAKAKGAAWAGSTPWIYKSFPLKLNENFNGSRLNSRYWTYRQTGSRLAHTRKVSMSHPSATGVKGGTLQLRVHKASSKHKNYNNYSKKEWKGKTLKYINGHVGTENKFSFKYGFAAARVNFATNRGQHGSFWLQSARAGGDEIDTVEFFGKGYPKRGLSHFIHTRSGSKTKKIGGLVDSHKWFAKGHTPYNSYHVYSVEWTPRKYVFRMDGHVVKTINRTTSKQEQFLVLSQLTSDWELEEVYRKGRSSLRKAFEKELKNGSTTSVDWVRVWVDPSGTYSDASKGIVKQKP